MEDKIRTLEETGSEEINPSEKKPSLFSNYVKEENPVIGNKEEEIPVSLPSSELVFEITYLENVATKQSAEVYTKTEPTLQKNGVVVIADAFGCSNLKETVLGRQVVERKCRKELANTEFTVDCKQGILIKAIEPQAWMFQDEKETKDAFDKAVLDTFRVVQEQVTKELHEQAMAQAQIQAQIEEQNLLKLKQNAQHGNISEGVPVHNPTYRLRPGDEGYNPNNDPNRRGAAQLASDQLSDLD